jgi:hypothetical protein
MIPEPGVFYCNTFLIFICIIPVLLPSPSKFFYTYSYPLHLPSFSCAATIHYSPSQLFFLILLIHSFPCLHLPTLSSPTYHHTSLPSYTLTACWVACCTNCTHSQLSEIFDTSTVHYNRINTPKHTQGLQKPGALYFFPNPTTPTAIPLYSATFTNSQNL